ncbi:MAG: hypothetical protein PHC86_06495 [Eubacteriales bacterium]|nr:hypothetical protein [Eubacteriales bacterium]
MMLTLLKALSYFFIILLTYLFKKKGLLKSEDQRAITFIVMNITFPAAIVINLSALDLNLSYFSIIFLGVACNFVMLLWASLFSRRHATRGRGLLMLSTSGYNIGTFAMPFIQTIIGPFGAGIVGLFDIGNAAMVTGGSYAVTSRFLHREKAENLRKTVNTLAQSKPFVTYIVMLGLAVFKIKIPTEAITFITPIGVANSFMAMLMIGLFLEIRLDRKAIKTVSSVLFLRFSGSTVLAVLFFYFLPFSVEVRHILIVILFSPLSVMTPIFTRKIGDDEALASLLTSLTVITSLVIMTILIVMLKF